MTIQLARVLVLEVEGIPRARPRPRHGARINKAGKAYSTTYQPKKLQINKKTGKPTPESLAWVRAQEWYQAVQKALDAHPKRPTAPLEGPLQIDIDVFMERPAWLDERYADGTYKYAPHEQWAPVAPDRDNLDKSVTDSLAEARLYLNDGQIVAGAVRKFYHHRLAGPGTIVTVSRILTTPAGELLVDGKPPKLERINQRRKQSSERKAREASESAKQTEGWFRVIAGKGPT